MGVAAAHLLDQPRGWAGMQPVGIRDDEAAGELVGVAIDIGRGCCRGRPEMADLSGECARGFRGHLASIRSVGRGHSRDHQTFHQGSGTQHHPLTHIVVEQFEREFGGQHRAAEVHQHDDACTLIRRSDGVDDLRSIGPEGGVVEACGDRDADLLAVQHLLGQRHRGAGQRPAV